MASTPVQTVDPRQQLEMPAILLAVAAGIAAFTQVVLLILRVFGAGIGALTGGRAPEQVAHLMAGTIGVIIGVLVLLIQAFIIWGAMQMRQLRSYGAAMAASILGMVPCFFPCCCPLGLPFGIWALVVLLRPEVKTAFR
jgi:hypothetical protein